MKRIVLFSLFLAGIALAIAGMLLWGNALTLKGTVIWPLTYRNYEFRNEPTPGLDQPAPQIGAMPALKQFTMPTLLAKVPPLKRGAVKTVDMHGNIGFDKFTENRRHAEFSALQKRERPQAVEIVSGVYDMDSLYKALNDEAVLARKGSDYLLRLPLYVGPDATLVVGGKDNGKRTTLRLSSQTGAFLLNGGKMFVLHTDVRAWDDDKNRPALFENDRKFRPFITTWSNSETYFGQSGFYDLGYHASKSYGISFSSLKPLLKKDPHTPAPRGWIIDSRFERLFYGFYSYEAEHVNIVNNVYADNIIYGIDPHDRSKYLLIAGNTAYGTQKKHGIIVSREVNDSWIVNNYAHDNHGSGFMLDRTSVRNLVAGNVAFRNGNDGLTLFESGDNVIVDNKFILNGRSGLRVRNSSNVIAERNLYLLNKSNGAQVYSFDITKTESERDFELDPFTPHTTLTIKDSWFIFNRGAMYKFNDIDLLRISGTHFTWYEPRMVRGDFEKMTYEIAVAMRYDPRYIEIRKTRELDPALMGSEIRNVVENDDDEDDESE